MMICQGLELIPTSQSVRGTFKEFDMGLLDILNGMENGPGGAPTPTRAGGSGGGMSPIMMALLGLLAYKATKGLGGGGQPGPADSGGGLGDILGGLLGGKPSGGPFGGGNPQARMPQGMPSGGGGGGLGGLLGGSASPGGPFGGGSAPPGGPFGGGKPGAA